MTHFAPIAACGRALSDDQIEAILAIHPRAPVLAADGDHPGRQANIDWARRMLAKGRESAITDWPDGYDPASWLAARGADGLMGVARRGCLDDHRGILRPRHCGAVLTEADFPDHDPRRDPADSQLSGTVTRAIARLPPAARQRYLASAALVLAVSDRPPSRASPWPVTELPRPQSAPPERINF